MLRIAEKYIAISGEAPAPGIPVYLIRFHGCNLSCSYCDTRIEREPAESADADALVSDIRSSLRAYPSLAVLFTGGEPLLGERQDELVRVMRRLDGVRFFVETNGSVDIVDTQLQNCSYVVDLKTPSSGHGDSFLPGLAARLRPEHDCIKIVLAESDLDWVKLKLDELRRENEFLPVYLSPQWGKLELKRLAGFILENRLDARISIQLHKYIWGENARGV